VVVGGAGLYYFTVNVKLRDLPDFFKGIRRGATAKDLAPVYYTPYQRLRDENGNCPPPDPDKLVKWRGTQEDHWHYIEWNANPDDCTYYPKFKSSPADPGSEYTEISR